MDTVNKPQKSMLRFALLGVVLAAAMPVGYVTWALKYGDPKSLDVQCIDSTCTVFKGIPYFFIGPISLPVKTIPKEQVQLVVSQLSNGDTTKVAHTMRIFRHQDFTVFTNGGMKPTMYAKDSIINYYDISVK
jgi:hypothetical protein